MARAISTLKRLDEIELEEATDEEWEQLERHRQGLLKTAENRGWRMKRCATCRGSGTTFVEGFGVDHCDTCRGDGSYWVSPKGRIADYPGGPLRGSVGKEPAVSKEPSGG